MYALGFTFTHARRQVDFLPDRNPERLFGVQRTHPAPVDFIGAVETIDADFARLRERIGLPAVPLLHRNATADAQAPAVRCDPATRRLVEQLYAADLAFTGCTSEDALPEPSARDMGTAQHPPSGRAVRPRPPPAAPAGPGTWFSRARYDLGDASDRSRGPAVPYRPPAHGAAAAGPACSGHQVNPPSGARP